MSTARLRAGLCTVLVALLFLAARAPAQEPIAALAEALLQALAPERDDPDAQVRALLEAALLARHSPAAALAAGEARTLADEVADPLALRRWLREQAGDQACHGLLTQRLRELDFGLFRRAGGDRPADPFRDHAREVTVIGPFGDAGSHWLSVPLPPDDRFPEAGEQLPGRFGPVAPRRVLARPDRHSLSLLCPQQPLRGAHYLLWRVRAAAAAAGFLEVEYGGSVLARVDGYEIGRVDPYVQPAAAVQRFGVRLQAGEHRIVLKTGDGSERPIALRLLDGDGAPLAGVTEVAPDAPPAPAATDDPRDGARFGDGLTQFEQAAASQTGEGAAQLRVAAAWAAWRTGEADRALALALAALDAPPALPAGKLVLADVVLRLTDLPEEQRAARAHELEDKALAALPPAHHRALLARVRQLEDQDQREAALRLLRAEVDAGRAGPATFARMYDLVRRLQFHAEVPALLRTWSERCPGDVRPLSLLADHLLRLGDAPAAYDCARRAFLLQPFDEALLPKAFRLGLDLGDFDGVAAMLDRVYPPDEDPPSLWRTTALVTIAARRGDDAALRRALAAVAAHPDADAATFRRLAERWLQLGDDAAARSAIEQSLHLDADQPPLRELRARLGGPAAPGADFARFRRDGDAVIAACRPGPEEGRASTSLLIDQRLVEVLPDGSSVAEVHELRRINDLQGVEALREASDPARADELLLLRTVGTDGRTYIPKRVRDGFAMPRLEPGAFVEWRYREHERAPGAESWQLDPFLLASHQEPLHLTEYVLILPPGARGELRTRNLPAPPATVPLDDGRKALVARRESVPRVPEEDSPPPADELLPLVAYGEDASPWPSLRQTRAALLQRSRPTAPIRAFAATLLAGAAGDGERVRRIADFCAREIGDGPSGDATEVLLRKKGNRFLLAVALLRAAGVPLQAAACSRQRDEPDGVPPFQPPEPAPVPALLVTPADGAPLWLFADSVRYLPPGTIPAQRGGALAFLIGDGTVAQVRLPAAASAEQDAEVSGTCTVEKDAIVLRGRAGIGDVAGYALAEQLRRRTADLQVLAARQIAQRLFPDRRVRKAGAADLDPPGRPVAITFELQDAGPQPLGGDRWLLPLPLPSSDLRQSFGDRDERTLPLHLEHDIDLRFHLTIEPDAERRFVTLPPPLLVAFGPLDYQLTFTRDGDRVVVDRRLRLVPATLPVSLYGNWLETLTAIDHAEGQGLLLAPRHGGQK